MKRTVLHLVFFLSTAAAIAIPTQTAVATASVQTPTSFNITNIPPPTGGDQDHDQDTGKGKLTPWEQWSCSMKHHHKTKSAHHKMKHPTHQGGKDTKGYQAPGWQRCKKHLTKHLPPKKMQWVRSVAEANGTRASSAGGHEGRKGHEGHKGHKGHKDHGECFKKCVGFKMPFISKLIPEGIMEPVCEGICGCKGSEQCKGKESGGEEKPKEENPPVPYQGMSEMHEWKEWIAKKEIEPAKDEGNVQPRSVGDGSTAHV
ncbi:uncharacterized protein BDZ83DRAFT_756588 [Colletotrichum acutatum]|uniref:Uncharacterized protein n=1 Tax=Glomerella acutata TaxID=27357 RepID=A0AAD8XCS3_GLOAC|nr:uncharacterized protein BDZ83DRAFT_756588 [Colletotrichum acutatum]KAK1714147.1 hypothetical protein BDZ83DRAFT_756588 [Colletotrichum acutatum]